MTRNHRSELQDNSREGDPFSYRFPAFQLPEATGEFGVDDRDRPFAAAAVLGAIDANIVWILLAVYHSEFRGVGHSPPGIGSLIAGLLTLLVGIILFVVPVGVFGALIGMFVNIFLQRSKWGFLAMLLTILVITLNTLINASWTEQ